MNMPGSGLAQMPSTTTRGSPDDGDQRPLIRHGPGRRDGQARHVGNLGDQFSRNGAPVPRARRELPDPEQERQEAGAEQSGWKDVVLVEEHAEILVRFDNPAPPKMPFMYHCHILEHEDHGMMGQFAVV